MWCGAWSRVITRKDWTAWNGRSELDIVSRLSSLVSHLTAVGRRRGSSFLFPPSLSVASVPPIFWTLTPPRLSWILSPDFPLARADRGMVSSLSLVVDESTSRRVDELQRHRAVVVTDALFSSTPICARTIVHKIVYPTLSAAILTASETLAAERSILSTFKTSEFVLLRAFFRGCPSRPSL
jgi:hypothetical protein